MRSPIPLLLMFALAPVSRAADALDAGAAPAPAVNPFAFRCPDPVDGGTVRRSALVLGEPEYKPQATVATARGLIGMTGASEPTFGIGKLDAPTAPRAGDLSIQRERHTTHCSFAGAFHCPGTRVVAQVRGDLLLACVPQNQGADCDRFLRTEERRCVLVDFKRSTCHDLTTFDDVRFLANGRLEVTTSQRAPLCRTPSSVWDMDHFGRLQDVAASTDVSWIKVHAVFAFDEGLRFVSVDTRAE